MIVRKPRVRHQLYGLQTGGPREAGVLKLTLAVHITILSRLPHHPVRQRDRLVLELCYTLAGNMHKILNRSREAFRAGDLLPYLNRRHMASSCKLADGERFGQCQTSLTRAMTVAVLPGFSGRTWGQPMVLCRQGQACTATRWPAATGAGA